MPAVSTQLNDFILPAAPAARSRQIGGLWRRIGDALHDAQMRRAERDIALMIERRGGRITDDLERQIQRQFV